jgi:hypothetical protein
MQHRARRCRPRTITWHLLLRELREIFRLPVTPPKPPEKP